MNNLLAVAELQCRIKTGDGFGLQESSLVNWFAASRSFHMDGVFVRSLRRYSQARRKGRGSALIGFLLGFSSGVVQFFLLMLYFAVRRLGRIARTDRSNRSPPSPKRRKQSAAGKASGDSKAHNAGKRGWKAVGVVVFTVTQFLFPFAMLILSDILFGESMLWTAAGLALSMTICFVVRFALTVCKARQAPRARK